MTPVLPEKMAFDPHKEKLKLFKLTKNIKFDASRESVYEAIGHLVSLPQYPVFRSKLREALSKDNKGHRTYYRDISRLAVVAAVAHRWQPRNDGRPASMHFLGVANTLLDANSLLKFPPGKLVRAVKVSLLHDIAEDTNYPLSLLKGISGGGVLGSVSRLTILRYAPSNFDPAFLPDLKKYQEDMFAAKKVEGGAVELPAQEVSSAQLFKEDLLGGYGKIRRVNPSEPNFRSSISLDALKAFLPRREYEILRGIQYPQYIRNLVSGPRVTADQRSIDLAVKLSDMAHNYRHAPKQHQKAKIERHWPQVAGGLAKSLGLEPSPEAVQGVWKTFYDASELKDVPEQYPLFRRTTGKQYRRT